MTTWREDFAAIIAEGTKHLPRDATLAERKAAVSASRPHWASTTSWGRKSWQAARRDYLIPFGYEAQTKRAKEQRATQLPLFDR